MSRNDQIHSLRHTLTQRQIAAQFGISVQRVNQILNPEKHKARHIVTMSKRYRTILAPSKCENCGRNVHLQAHHDDYSKPKDVRWLCKDCHCAITKPPHTGTAKTKTGSCKICGINTTGSRPGYPAPDMCSRECRIINYRRKSWKYDQAGNRHCSRCGNYFPISDFYFSAGRPRSECKKCWNKYLIDWRRNKSLHPG